MYDLTPPQRRHSGKRERALPSPDARPRSFVRRIAAASLGASLLLGAVACSSGSAGTDPEPEPPEEEIDPRLPVGQITLDRLPVDVDRLVAFHGLGNLNVLPEDHGGFFPPREAWDQPPTIPVYAPSDGVIHHLIADWQEPWGHDLTLEMRVSSTMVVSFGHMSDYAPEIWEAAEAQGLEPRSGIPTDVDIEVDAGQIIGYMGTQGAMDWYIGDDELKLDFVNPSRYPDPWLVSGCYTDYLGPTDREALRSIALRQDEPRCGRIDYDVDGRIVGNWFLEGEVPDYAFEDYSTHFAIVYDDYFGDRIAIADGISIRPDSPHEGDENYYAARVFWVEGNAPAPETIGIEAGLVKYPIMKRALPPPWDWDTTPPELETVGTFLIQMLDSRRIRVERFMGKTQEEVAGFGEHARVYVR